jgi:hypothetical protein
MRRVALMLSQVVAKMEYHGDREADREELTGQELAKWWAQVFMRPGSSLLVHPPSISCVSMLLMDDMLHQHHGHADNMLHGLWCYSFLRWQSCRRRLSRV